MFVNDFSKRICLVAKHTNFIDKVENVCIVIEFALKHMLIENFIDAI